VMVMARTSSLRARDKISFGQFCAERSNPERLKKRLDCFVAGASRNDGQGAFDVSRDPPTSATQVRR
ncbi:MAG: hypothetical protein ABI146_02815, partial [Nitrobacter sp.]